MSQIPFWGISLVGIDKFSSQIAQMWGENIDSLCTSDIVQKYFLPMTILNGRKLSYCELNIDQAFVGTATVFVSHAWSHKFVDVVAALRQWSLRNSSVKTYFWFDVFSNNQHMDTSSPDFHWWTSVFKSNIERIGRTLLVLQWDNPIPLTRSWCLWEIYCSICRTNSTVNHHSNAKERKISFEIIMNCEQEHKFSQNLVSDFSSVLTMISDVDMRKARATNPSDEINIFEAVNNQVGITTINNLISRFLREWMVVAALGVYAQLHNSIGIPHSPPPQSTATSALQLVSALSVFLASQGRVYLAEELLERANSWAPSALGADHPNVLQMQSRYSSVLGMADKFNEAIALMCGVIRRKEKGKSANPLWCLSSPN